jgi:ABC-type polysaccharide/polyol phosphate export permease
MSILDTFRDPVLAAFGKRFSSTEQTLIPERKVEQYTVRQKNWRNAWADICEGLGEWRLWIMLAWQDTRQRYSRTVIGPFWMTLSIGLFVATMGFLYSVLFQQPASEYIPFLAAGYISWMFFSVVVTESCGVFSLNKSIIEVRKIPASLFVYRMITRNLIGYGHNMVVYVIVALWFGIYPGLYILLLLPALFLIMVSGVWLGLILGLVSARFRDVPQLITNLLTVLFFVTPVIWVPNMSGNRLMAFANFNVLYHYVSVLRQPLLGRPPDGLSWLVVIGTTVFGMLISFILFARFRSRIPYWL